MALQVTIKGLAELQKAVDKAPKAIATEVNRFLVRGIATYNRIIIGAPWRIGMQGGGAPVFTGNLRDTHIRTISGYRGIIRPDAWYAPYVHGTDGKRYNKNGVQLRPWLDYAKQQGDPEIMRLTDDLLNNVMSVLAS